MKKGLKLMVVFTAIFLWISVPVFGSDIELAKKSTLEQILKRGELLVGMKPVISPLKCRTKREILSASMWTWPMKWEKPFLVKEERKRLNL